MGEKGPIASGKDHEGNKMKSVLISPEGGFHEKNG